MCDYLIDKLSEPHAGSTSRAALLPAVHNESDHSIAEQDAEE